MNNEKHTLLKTLLQTFGVALLFKKDILHAQCHNKDVSFTIVDGVFVETSSHKHSVIHLDQLINTPEKVAALILSRLKLNKTIYARSCTIKKVEKKTTEIFLERYHLLGSTQSATNLGLYLHDELLALASFSKGRKMNRLQDHKRSFELIRFCCKPGITVTGGLSRLIKAFCEEKKAGDIMTYIDKQISDGKSFIKAGFKKHSETEPNYFLVDRLTYQRRSANKDETFDPDTFYLTHNTGSIKLIYTPND